MRNSPQIIHRLIRPAALTAALTALVGAAGCGTSNTPTPPPTPGAAVLAPSPNTLWIRPGDHDVLRFVLRTTGGDPVPGQRLRFGIVDGGDSGAAKGATLSSDNAVTDGNGYGQVTVNAGQLAVFRVRASTDDQELESEAVVVVNNGMPANVQVAPFLLGGADTAANVTGIDVALYDDTHCVNIPFSRLPASARQVQTVPATDGVAQFDYVSVVLSYAVVGRARDRLGRVQAQGCTDLPGSTLVAGALVRLTLPLGDAGPSPTGRFDVTSRFSFANPPAASASIAAPWVDLQDCPLDPAQLWLDCTLDALSGDSADDPSDCRPVPGGEGPLGLLLEARRGVLLTGGDGAPSACRGSRDASGAPSLDAIVAGLFGPPKPAGLVSLHAIAQDAARILSTLTLRSQLTVTASASDGQFDITHTLTSAELSTSATTSIDVDLAPLALTNRTAVYVRGATHGQLFQVDEQRFTLRLGTVARAAFGQLALVSRGLPADLELALTALMRLAAVPLPPDVAAATATATANGCAALDMRLCAEVGRPDGCLLASCSAGLAVLAARFEAGFAAANGTSLDLVIDQGVVPMIDAHNTGVADRLGDVRALPSQPGTWSATLRTRAGNEKLTAQWDATRAGN